MDKEMIRDYELDIIIKAWRDEKFRRSLLKNPKKAIEDEFSVRVPSDMEIFVHEESEQSLHLIVPSIPSNFDAEELTDDELKDVIGGVLSLGHLGAFPSKKERGLLREMQKENSELKKSVDKLTHELATIKQQLPKK